MPTDDKERQERLAAALRENLRRRKAQARDLVTPADAPQRSASAARVEEALAMLARAQNSDVWRHAVSLIDQAAADGNADAIERRALFECMGLGRNPDWNRALDSLGLAAASGSASARDQLGALAGSSPVLPDQDWHELRSRIDPAALLRSPPATTLSANPLVRAISGFLRPAECEWLIARARPRLQRAIVYSKETGEAGVDTARTNQFALFDLVNLDCVTEVVRARIASAIGAPLPCLEVSQVLRYGTGEEFATHCDYLDPVTMAQEIRERGQRAATVLIYLNTGFEEGATFFPDLPLKYRGEPGDALLFSNVDPRGEPEPRTRHAGEPPTSGEKWLFSQWIRDRLPA